MTTEWSLSEAELPALVWRRPGAATAGADAADAAGAGAADAAGADAAGTGAGPDSVAAVQAHLRNVLPALESLRSQSFHLAAWGEELARRLLRGQRLLAAGNGGSAAEAQHLTAELVGRFDAERAPFSAISLHAETSAVTAIANDYGFEELFARQVRAHARPGDLLMLLSTSGKSPNLLRAAEAAAPLGVTTWALTGRAPNPLAGACDEAVAIDGLAANAQECHLIALHAVCRAFDTEVLRLGGRDPQHGVRP